MHEIITVQLGQQSNYLATHFWNTQESYFTYSEGEESLVDHDIHWRPGIGSDGTDTFMPRTVIYDLKGGFGSLRKINALYADQDENEGIAPQALWNGPTTLHKQPPITPSPYQQSLEAGDHNPAPLTTSTVRYWSDFSRVYYHPRSAVQLSEYELGSRLMPFERYDAGEELFAGLDREHDVLDRDLRPFVEEADQMQGLQIMAGLDDAWAGFAARYLERVRDEYGKTPVWVWGIEGDARGLPRDKRLLRLANKARALTDIYKQASIVVPLAIPPSLPRSILLDATSRWHTSALLASALESITLPSRLKDPANRDTLGSMADALNAMGKQTVAGLQMSFASPGPDPSTTTHHSTVALTDTRDRRGHHHQPLTEDGLTSGLSLDVSFSPSDELDSRRPNGFGKHGYDDGDRKPKVFSQLVALRGYPPAEDEGDGDGDGDGDVEMDQDERNLRRRRNAEHPVTRSYTTPLRFPLLDSFPHIFPHIFRDSEGGGDPLASTEINVTSSLSTDSSVSGRLKLLRTTVSRSIGLEDREALSNDLAEMADEYHEGWSSGSDEGEDD